MNRTASLLAVVALVVVGVAVPAGVAATAAPGTAEHASQTANQTASNESTGPPAPGAQLAAVVSVQGTEVESDLEDRTFGIQVARSNSNASKAGVVADRLGTLEQRLEALRERERTLEEARENGTISEARYRGETTALAARIAALERQLNRTEAVVDGLPTGSLESAGVNASAIERLRNESRALAGPEVAAIARTIAGTGAGAGLGGLGATVRGPPSTPGAPNGTQGPNAPGRPTTEGNETVTAAGSTPDQPGTEPPGRPTDAGRPGGANTPGPPPGGNQPGSGAGNGTADANLVGTLGVVL